MFKSIITIINRNKNVIKYGVITNTAIGIFLRGIGDVIQQNIEIKNDEKKKEKNVMVYQLSDSKTRVAPEKKTETNSGAKKMFDWTRTSKIKTA
jgi:hypothetical protein